MILQNVRAMYTLYFLLLRNLYAQPGAAVYNPEIKSRGLHRLSGPAPQTVFDKTLCRPRFFFLLGKYPGVQEPGVGWLYIQIHEKSLDLLPMHNLFFTPPPTSYTDIVAYALPAFWRFSSPKQHILEILLIAYMECPPSSVPWEGAAGIYPDPF